MNISKDRCKIAALKPGESISYRLSEYVRITRMLQDMNRSARLRGIVKLDELSWSVSRTDTKSFKVIKN